MKIALIGNPLKLSLSHILYQAISEITNEKIDFIKLETEKPFQALEFIKQQRFNGFFITIPYKRSFLSMFYEDECVKKTMNINCVKIDNEKFYATNTDYKALKKLIEIKGIDPSGKRCLIIGNGSAAMTSAVVLSELKISQIIIAARNHQKTENIKKLISKTPLTETDLSDIDIEVDILINTTPLGMYEELDLKIKPPSTSIIDFAYTIDDTHLIKKAGKKTTLIICGKEILVMQGLYGLEHISGKNFVNIYNESIRQFERKLKEIK